MNPINRKWKFFIAASLALTLVVLVQFGCNSAFLTKQKISRQQAKPSADQLTAVRSSNSPEVDKKVQVQENYGKLPLSFIRNDGQVDEKVKFYEEGSRHSTLFAKDGVYLSLTNGKTSSTSAIESTLIKLMPLGANKHPKIVAEGMQEGKVNYFIGNDSKNWKTNLPTYQAVVYQDIYPGIDLKFYGNNRQMEYDIIIKPGADPSKVKFAYEGIEGLRVTDAGDLEIGLKEGTILQKKPIVYQEIEGKRVNVEGTFKIQQTTSSHPKRLAYGFEVASYDKAHSLLIDPTLVYSTYLGGTSFDFGTGIAADGSGNAYVVGYTRGSGFPLANALQGTANPGQGSTCCYYDVFVTKFNPAGNALVYSTYLGGSVDDHGYAIAVDTFGNAYITGYTQFSGVPITNFPTTAGAFQTTTAGGDQDAFVAKLSSAGDALLYSTYLGGSSGDDTGYGIVVDAFGNAYVTGSTSSSNFPTANSAQAILGGGSDAFVTELNAAGSGLIYSTYLGGSGNEEGHGIAVDGFGNAYVTGYTTSTNFLTANPFQAAFAGGTDAFVTKLNPAGNALVYSTYLGGTGSDYGYGIAVDAAGEAYMAGSTGSSDFPIFNPLQTYGGSGDAFMTKLNPTGNALVYSTYLGGAGPDSGNGIALDDSGNAYVTGGTNSTNFPMANAPQTTPGGNGDVFIAKLNVAGNSLLYSTYLGGNGFDSGQGIAVDASGNAYVAGSTSSANFPTVNAFQPTMTGPAPQDAFVAKISPDETMTTTSTTTTTTTTTITTTTTSTTTTTLAQCSGFATVTIDPNHTITSLNPGLASNIPVSVFSGVSIGLGQTGNLLVSDGGVGGIISPTSIPVLGGLTVIEDILVSYTPPVVSPPSITLSVSGAITYLGGFGVPCTPSNGGISSTPKIFPVGTTTTTIATTTTTTMNNFKVTNFAPRIGLPGTHVTIIGRGFTGATVVAFNGTPATFTVSSNFVIRATVPVGATTGPVSVITPAGTVASPFNFTVPPPVLTRFVPIHAAAGKMVTIVGKYFLGATSVTFNGTPASFTVTSNYVIKATVPAGATTGPISVTTPYGTATSTANFAIP